MRLEIEIAGCLREVTVEQIPGAPGRFRVTWEGRTRLVDARRLDQDASMLSMVLLDGQPTSHEARLVETDQENELAVDIDGALVHAVVNGNRSGSQPGGGHTGVQGAKRIIVPMPGKIVRVLVQPGDVVGARQPLVVVEAMKMENELVATRPGTVKEVAVREGMSVEAGRLVVVIE